jgi:3-oxoadipate enol-lactonase
MVDRGDFRLAAVVSGREQGAPWLVLSNSLGATMMMWEPQLASLQQRYRILSYDARGHGASEAPPGPYAFDDLVADVIALMDRFGIGGASFMGLSLGGMTGLGLAIRHPDRLARLVCCDARADAPAPYVQGWNDRLAAVEKGGLAAIMPDTMERWFVERWRRENPDELRRFQEAFLATSRQGYRGCVAALQQLDYLKDLGQIRCPVLYVAGEKDMAASPATMQAMADATPQGQLAVVPDAAHLSCVDNGAAFRAAVAPFLDLA